MRVFLAQKKGGRSRPSHGLWKLLGFLCSLFTVGGFNRGIQSRQHLFGFFSMRARRLQLQIFLVSLGGSVWRDNFAARVCSCQSDQILALPEISIGTVRISRYGLIKRFDRLLADLDVIG